MPATLPAAEPVKVSAPPVVKPVVQAKAAADTSKEGAKADPPPKDTTKEPDKAPKLSARPVETVAHDYVPRNARERFALANGEMVRAAKPADPSPDDKAKADAAAAAAAKPDVKADASKATVTEITADSSDDEVNAHVESQAKGMSKELVDVFRHKNFELRESKRKLKEAMANATEVETLRGKVAELEKAPKVDPVIEQKLKDFDAVQKRLDEAENFVAAAKIEHSEAYRREIGGPLKDIESTITEITKRYDTDGSQALHAKITQAMQLTGAERADALEEITADMKRIDQQEIVEAARGFSNLMRQRDALMSNAKEKLSELDREQQANIARQTAEQQREAAERKAAWDKAVPEKWDSVLKQVGIAPIEGATDFNTRLTEASRFPAEVQFDELAVDSQVEVMARAAAYPFTLGKLVLLEEENAALKAENAKFNGAKPGAGEGNRNNGEHVEPDPDEGKTLGQSFVAGLERRRAEAQR